MRAPVKLMGRDTEQEGGREGGWERERDEAAKWREVALALAMDSVRDSEDEGRNWRDNRLGRGSRVADGRGEVGRRGGGGTGITIGKAVQRRGLRGLARRASPPTTRLLRRLCWCPGRVRDSSREDVQREEGGAQRGTNSSGRRRKRRRRTMSEDTLREEKEHPLTL